MSQQPTELYRIQLYKNILSEKNDESLKVLSTHLASDAARFQALVANWNRGGWRLYEQIFYMQQTLERIRRVVFEFDLTEEEAVRASATLSAVDDAVAQRAKRKSATAPKRRAK